MTSASERALIETAYSRYHDELYSLPSQRRWTVSFGAADRIFPESHDSKGLIFHQLNRSTLQTLAGDINRFHYQIRCLAAWEAVLPTFTDEKELVVVQYICVESLLGHTVLTPYNLKQRFVYCAAKCLFSIHASDKNATLRQVPADEKITLNVLEQWINTSEPTHVLLVNSIKRLDASTSQATSQNYRRKVVHRVPPHLFWGLRGDVQVKLDRTNYRQEFCLHRPLSIGEVLPALTEEHRLLRAAFASYIRFSKLLWSSI